MKRYRVDFTAFAYRCLEQIHEYIESESKSTEVADKFLLRLIDRVDQLSSFSESGQQELLLKAIGQESRYLLEGNYKIIVTDVFHTAQDPQKLKRGSQKL